MTHTRPIPASRPLDAYVGLTPRTATLFGPPGCAHVYRSYGTHAMLNAVCEGPGIGAAVLIRALEPIAGVEAMQERRGVDGVRQLCSGPGKLTQALGIGLERNGTSLLDGRVVITGRPAGAAEVAIVAGVRIGISKAVDLPWRFVLAGSPFISAPLRTTARVPVAPRTGGVRAPR